MKEKLVGRVFNDRWLVDAYRDEKYHLINTYNHQKMVLSFHTLIRIYRKEIDIDKMIAEKIRLQKRKEYFIKEYCKK